jgi:hypothetical protein
MEQLTKKARREQVIMSNTMPLMDWRFMEVIRFGFPRHIALGFDQGEHAGFLT